MAEEINSIRDNNGGCISNMDCLSSIIVFILVIGVIVASLCFMIFDLSRAEEVNHISIRVEAADSLRLQNVYDTEGIDSLICEVKRYEDRLSEKYQYLIEQREDDERFKTWGALIVGVIVSVCSFWGYRSLKDLRADVKKQTEIDTVTKVNECLNNQLNGLVRVQLTNTLRGDVTDIIKTHVMAALNSDEDNTISTRVKSVMESDKFDKQLRDIVYEKVVEVVDDMILTHHRRINGEEETSIPENENLTL